jgi:hypothetical protein
LASLALIQNSGLKSIKDSPTLKKSILELINIKPENKPEHIELMITFVVKTAEKTDDEQILKNIPPVRIIWTN